MPWRKPTVQKIKSRMRRTKYSTSDNSVMYLGQQYATQNAPRHTTFKMHYTNDAWNGTVPHVKYSNHATPKSTMTLHTTKDPFDSAIPSHKSASVMPRDRQSEKTSRGKETRWDPSVMALLAVLSCLLLSLFIIIFANYCLLVLFVDVWLC